MSLDRPAPSQLETLAAPSALLFDLDGTLVDSRRDIAVACNAARADHGLPPLAFEEIMAMVGDGARLLVTRAFAFEALDPRDPKIDAALASFSARYLAAPCVYTQLLPGARELIEDAARAKLRAAVVTNKPRDVTLAVLRTLGIEASFAMVWAGGDGPLKPAPDGVLAAIARLGAVASSTWMIGDGPQDIGAGKAAGCITIGIPGIAERARLLSSAPDLVFESLTALRETLHVALRPQSRADLP